MAVTMDRNKAKQLCDRLNDLYDGIDGAPQFSLPKINPNIPMTADMYEVTRLVRGHIGGNYATVYLRGLWT